MDPRAFLQLILPDSGWYVAFALHPTEKWTSGQAKSQKLAVGTVDELLAVLTRWNAEGWTCYHACAAFTAQHGVWDPKKGKRSLRSHENVAALASLYADIDTRESHAKAFYANRVEAAGALATFCNAENLPHPLLVSSGGGLHPYWPLEEELTRTEWQPLANALKAAMEANGLKGVERTTDSASVLRPPGTLHRKSGELVIVVNEIEGLFEVAPFVRLKEKYHGDTRHAPGVPASGATIHGRPGAGVLGKLYGAEFCDPRAIERSCRQIEKLVADPGACTEPHHYAGAGVFAALGEAGRAYFIEFERRYPGGSEEWCQIKLRQQAGYNGAKCDQFERVNPGGCDGCDHRGKIASPCYFARQAPGISSPSDNSQSAMGGSRQGQNGFHSAPTFIPAGAQSQILLPLDDKGQVRWRINARNQLVLCAAKKDGQPDEQIICDNPVWLDSIYDGELNKNTQSLVFRAWSQQDGDHEIMIPGAAFETGGGGYGKLLEGGVVVKDHLEFRNYWHAFHRDLKKTGQLMTRYEQCGWKKEETAFLVGEILYEQQADGPVIADNVKISEGLEPRALQLGPLKEASARDWLLSTTQLWPADHYAAWFLIYSSFAAPLMRLLDPNQGGVVVHAFCPQSGKGKTTALQAACSVWGTWKGFVSQNYDTVTSKPLMLRDACNLPVVMDELALMHDDEHPEILRNFVMMVNLGNDKKRAEQTGKNIRAAAGSWSTIVIAASNTSVIDILEAKARGTDAPAMRVLEIPWPVTDFDTAAGAQLVANILHHSGAAGDAFLRHLMKPDIMKWTRKQLQDAYRQLMQKLANEERFRAQEIACMYIAGCLLQQIGMAPAQPTDVVRWVLSKLHRGQVMVPKGAYQNTLEALNEYTSMHVNCTIRVPNAYVAGQAPTLIPVPPPRILMRYEASPGRLMIDTKAFKEWLVSRGLSVRDVMDDLAQSNVLVTEKKTAMCAGTTLPAVYKMCLVIDLNHPRLAGAIDMQKAANDG